MKYEETMNDTFPGAVIAMEWAAKRDDYFIMWTETIFHAVWEMMLTSLYVNITAVALEKSSNGWKRIVQKVCTYIKYETC